MKALAKSLLIIYALSIMGYAILDVTHEALHNIKNPFHQHVIKQHSHHQHEHVHHHHVEDHHHLLKKSDSKDKQVTTVNISCYFLFFHDVIKFKSPSFRLADFELVSNTRLPVVFLMPPSPPPLHI